MLGEGKGEMRTTGGCSRLPFQANLGVPSWELLPTAQSNEVPSWEPHTCPRLESSQLGTFAAKSLNCPMIPNRAKPATEIFDFSLQQRS